MAAKSETFHVEQMARGFYSQPKDANYNNSLRLLYDRWVILSSRNEIANINLMKLDEKKAPRDWQSNGFNSDQGFLTWSLSVFEFFQLIDKKAFQV